LEPATLEIVFFSFISSPLEAPFVMVHEMVVVKPRKKGVEAFVRKTGTEFPFDGKSKFQYRFFLREGLQLFNPERCCTRDSHFVVSHEV
jgi:hypothetical protein